MSTGCQQTSTQAMPTTRRVIVREGEHMPLDYSTTPGGTLFSTTPGGTRIIYDRKFLLECRSSPVAKTPPRYMADIPGVTISPTKDIGDDKARNREPLNNSSSISASDNKGTGDDAQFEMDI